MLMGASPHGQLMSTGMWDKGHVMCVESQTAAEKCMWEMYYA